MRLLLVLSLLVGMLSYAAEASEVERGEYLARAGDCVVCHTAPDGKPFAGGVKMAVPHLGVIYTTNITPDKETGIGAYSFEDFERAMRRGIARDGHHLYPAMPYPSFAKTTEEDLRALYAFFMQAVPPVKRANQHSEIPWPFNMRWPLAAWNLLFNASPDYTAKKNRDDQWNRGAYLVQGLGHCGSCHTPRGVMFQEKALDEGGKAFLAGGELDDWSASDLSQDAVSGLGRWSEDDIVRFLKNGHNDHATAFGTMIDVINNSTQYLSAADLAAIAKYLKALPPARADNHAFYSYARSTAQALTAGIFDSRGAKVYFQQCAFCHVADGRGRGTYLSALAGNPAVMDTDPASVINITLNGSSRIVVQGMPDAYRMPEFRVLLKDQEVVDVVNFVRQGWGNSGPPVTTGQVAKIRAATERASDAVVVLKMR